MSEEINVTSQEVTEENENVTEKKEEVKQDPKDHVVKEKLVFTHEKKEYKQQDNRSNNNYNNNYNYNIQKLYFVKNLPPKKIACL